MSVLSVLAFRMVTRSGPTECRRIWRALTRRDSPATETRVPAGPSKSAKRRARKKTLRDSMRAENGATTEGDLDLRPYDLVAHESRRSAKDFFQRSLMAAFLLKCLQRVGFFEKPARDDGTFAGRVDPLRPKGLQIARAFTFQSSRPRRRSRWVPCCSSIFSCCSSTRTRCSRPGAERSIGFAAADPSTSGWPSIRRSLVSITIAIRRYLGKQSNGIFRPDWKREENCPQVLCRSMHRYSSDAHPPPGRRGCRELRTDIHQAKLAGATENSGR